LCVLAQFIADDNADGTEEILTNFVKEECQNAKKGKKRNKDI